MQLNRQEEGLEGRIKAGIKSLAFLTVLFVQKARWLAASVPARDLSLNRTMPRQQAGRPSARKHRPAGNGLAGFSPGQG